MDLADGLREPLLAKGGGGADASGFFAAGSKASSVVVLISAGIGTGVLALPYGVSRVGVLPALALFALAGAASYSSNVILFRCVHKTGVNSYGELMMGILGRSGAMVLDAFVAVEGLAAVSTYLVFIMDYVPQICEIGGPDVWCTDRGRVVTVASLIIWPLSCLEGLSALRWTSTCSLLTIIITSIVVVAKAPSLFLQTGLTFSEAASARPGGISDSFQALSMACFAFMVHTNTPEIAQAMRSRTQRSSNQVVAASTGLLWIVYSLISTCGFLSFLGETNQDFLTNYEALFNILEGLREKPEDGQHRELLYNISAIRIPVATACFAMSLGIAIRTPHVAELIGAIGTFLSSPLMFGFPALMYRRILKGRDVFLPTSLIALTFVLWGAELARLLS